MSVFNKLNAIDVSEKVEKKQKLTYLSWAWAWSEVKKNYPSASYTIFKNELNQPYIYDEKTGYMCYTTVTIEDESLEMWLPVMDGANKAMFDESYTYNVKDWGSGGTKEKTVEAATMFDVNKTIMRCLTKNLAMFGIGLYIYAGEDLPEKEELPKQKPKASSKNIEVLIKSFTKENYNSQFEKARNYYDFTTDQVNELEMYKDVL